MGYYIARDGQQLGPISPAQVAEGLTMGALRNTDLAWTDGMEGWRPLFEVFPISPPSPVPPPLPPQPPAVAASNFTLPPVAAPYSGGRAETSGLAIASLILGILGFFFSFFTAIPALICGHKALNKIKRSAGTLKGRGKAIAGLVMGYLVLFIVVPLLLLAIAIPNIGNINAKARESMISRSMNKVVGHLKDYAAAHQGEYPPTLETALSGPELATAFETMPSNWTQEAGFDYLGAGLKPATAGNQLILISRAKGPRGERIAVYNDGTVTFEPLADPR